MRYQEPANQFDSMPQIIVSYKIHEKDEHDEYDSNLVKWVRLHVFAEGKKSGGAFEASCETINTVKLYIYWFRPGNEAADRPSTFYYNENLKLVVSPMPDG